MILTERVKIKIDLTKVATNLRTSDGNRVAEGTARSFMNFTGFSLDEEGNWVGPRAKLRQFNPGEVVRVDPA